MEGFKLGEKRRIVAGSDTWTLTGTGRASGGTMTPLPGGAREGAAFTRTTVKCECSDGRVAWIDIGDGEALTEGEILARIGGYLRR